MELFLIVALSKHLEIKIEGKTCILLIFIDDSFTANHLTTIGIDFKSKIINLKGKIKLQILDTTGQESLRTITKTYYKRALGIILTYDVMTKFI